MFLFCWSLLMRLLKLMRCSLWKLRAESVSILRKLSNISQVNKVKYSQIRDKFITKWNLVHVFIMIMWVKYRKSALFGLGDFFYLKKLRTRLFSWNISVFKVNECRKLYFLFLYITKYFVTIHIYQIIIFSPLLYLSWWTSL